MISIVLASVAPFEVCRILCELYSSALIFGEPIMLLGKTRFVSGAFLLVPIVYFGLGLVGFGVDDLTLITGNYTLSKLVLGAITSASIMLMVNGYLTMRDGVCP